MKKTRVSRRKRSKKRKNEGKKKFSEEKIKNTREKRDTLLNNISTILRRRMYTKKILADTYVVILLLLSLLLCLSATTNFGVFAEQELVLPIGKEFELLCELEDFEKANEVAQKLAREIIERGGGSGGGNNFYNVRARESGRLRFTHDTSEYGLEETMNSESLMQRTANTGNPGVMYARVENVNVNNQNWPYFQFGKRDATMSIMCAPPSSAKYYSYVTYVWRKTFGALGLRSLRQTVSAQASSSPVNNKNVLGSRAFRRALVIISTASSKTFHDLKEVLEDTGIASTSIELEALRYDELNFLPSIIADDLTTSFRVGIWPLKGAEALGVYARYEWPAMIVRGREPARAANSGGNSLLNLLSLATISRPTTRQQQPEEEEDERQHPDVFYSKEYLPMLGPNDALFPSSLNDKEKDSQSKIHHRAMKQKTSLNAAADEFQSKLTNAFGNANKFALERVVVNDGAKCLSDPSYQPFSLPGVNVRSGCFGSTADAAYSLSEKLVNNLGELSDGNIVADASALTEESQDFIVLVFGENAVHDGRATFFNVAAYTTGDPVSSRLTDRSALFVSIVASLDDRSFDESASSPSHYSAAFATSERACSKLKSASIKSPCAVMLERNFGNVFLIERVYLDPKTATAPKDIAKTHAFVVKV